MVAIAALGSATAELVQGLSPEDAARVEAALAYANDAYQDKLCSSGHGALEFSIGVASTLAFLRSDAETRIAGLMFEQEERGGGISQAAPPAAWSRARALPNRW